MLKRLLLSIVPVAVFLAVPLSAKEFAGMKLEYMNAQNTSFYGLGLFTSDKRFDAEIEFFMASKAFEGESSNNNNNTASNLVSITPEYPLFYASFAGYFHFLRTDKMSFYLGGGIMPLLLRSYAYHFTFGADYFWSQNFRAFYTFRFIETGGSNISFPRGPSFAAGIKWTFDFL